MCHAFRIRCSSSLDHACNGAEWDHVPGPRYQLQLRLSALNRCAGDGCIHLVYPSTKFKLFVAVKLITISAPSRKHPWELNGENSNWLHPKSRGGGSTVRRSSKSTRDHSRLPRFRQVHFEILSTSSITLFSDGAAEWTMRG